MNLYGLIAAGAILLGSFYTPAASAKPIDGSLADSAANESYAKTKYPVILIHGLGGFSKMAWGTIQYWYKIPQTLRRYGSDVFEVDVSAFNSDEVRGEQLLQQIRVILAVTKADKVNLIGHSQGGLTARYVAAVAPQLVASITTIGTPHKGSKVADVIAGLSQEKLEGIDQIANFIGFLESLLSADKHNKLKAQSGFAAMTSLTSAGAEAFNQKYPSAALPKTCGGERKFHHEGKVTDNPNIPAYSWSGNKNVTAIQDPSDWLLSASGKIMKESENDGLVSVCSADFGQRIGVYRWNHVDEVNQILGVTGSEVSPVQTILVHLNRLKIAGL